MRPRVIAVAALLAAGSAVLVIGLRGGADDTLAAGGAGGSGGATPSSAELPPAELTPATRRTSSAGANDATAEDDPEYEQSNGEENVTSDKPFLGKPSNDPVGRNADKLADFRPITDLLSDAGREPSRVKRLTAFRDAAKVCRIWWRDRSGTGTATQILTDLLALHAAETDATLRLRALHAIRMAVPPQHALPVLERVGERARDGSTTRERRAAIGHLGSFAAKGMEMRFTAYAAAGSTRKSVRSASGKFRARAMDLLRGLPTEGRDEAERAAIAAAIAEGGGDSTVAPK